MSEVLGESRWSEGLTNQINAWSGEIDADKWSHVAEDKKPEIIQTAKDVNEFIIWLRAQNPNNQEEIDVVSQKFRADFDDLSFALSKHSHNQPLRALHSFVGNKIAGYMHYLRAMIRHPEEASQAKNIYEEHLNFAQTQIGFILAQEINLQ
jgi:hypothetical protein